MSGPLPPRIPLRTSWYLFPLWKFLFFQRYYSNLLKGTQTLLCLLGLAFSKILLFQRFSQYCPKGKPLISCSISRHSACHTPFAIIFLFFVSPLDLWPAFWPSPSVSGGSALGVSFSFLLPCIKVSGQASLHDHM